MPHSVIFWSLAAAAVAAVVGCLVCVWYGRRSALMASFRQYIRPEALRRLMREPGDLREQRICELTVVYADLVGFTDLSDAVDIAELTRLQSVTAESLHRIAVSRGGTVEQLLGDGLKLFFGPPEHDSAHPSNAIATVFALQAALRRQQLSPPLPGRHLRAGIATGELGLGNIGGGSRFSYGAHGYADFLARALERANARFGTSILMDERTAAVVRDWALVRTVGRLKLPDLPTPVAAYEPIAPVAEATARQNELAHLTEQFVAAFAAGRFADCVSLADETERTGGPDALADLYRRLARRRLNEPPGADFDGVIVVAGL